MTTNDNFIGYHQIQDLSICDDLIEFWKNSLNKKPGESYSPAGGSLVDTNWKDSLDVNIDPNYNSPLFRKYIEELRKSIEVYKETFPFSAYYSSWKIVEGSNIQYYKPGAGFKAWHCERGSAAMPITTRHLAWMTYLNDVNDGGGTEFFHQKLTIQAKKGLTVIWPADWTYTHRGVISPTQEKYIITGWFNYFSE
jgi:prolyl 4-hydroxylase